MILFCLFKSTGQVKFGGGGGTRPFGGIGRLRGHSLSFEIKKKIIKSGRKNKHVDAGRSWSKASG